MDTAVIVPVIVAIIGGGTVGVVFTTVYNRICNKHDRRDEMAKDIKWLKEQSIRRDVEVSKLQLTQLIQHSPKDHRAIIDEAERYFLKLKGDSWVYGVVKQWALEEGVEIGYIEAAHHENSKKKYFNKEEGEQ